MHCQPNTMEQIAPERLQLVSPDPTQSTCRHPTILNYYILYDYTEFTDNAPMTGYVKQVLMKYQTKIETLRSRCDWPFNQLYAERVHATEDTQTTLRVKKSQIEEHGGKDLSLGNG